MNIILISIMGVSGILLRYSLDIMISKPHGLSNLLVNSLGCLIAGVVIGLVQNKVIESSLVSPILVGLCGGLTTFSGFIILLEQKTTIQSLIFALVSVIACLLTFVFSKNLTQNFFSS